MDFVFRTMGAADRAAWLSMRAELWPDESGDAHAARIDEMLGSAETFALVAETPAGEALGFAEIAIRTYANGCETRPVPFLEGIWVAEQVRRQGIGTRLITQAEAFLAARGFREIGSDTEIDNEVSQAAHLAWGFSETERVVYFRKTLTGAAG